MNLLRLLLPGTRIKRWILVGVAGMLCFAYGFDLLLSPTGPREALWRVWNTLTGLDMAPRGPRLAGIVLAVVGVGLVSWGVRRLIRAFTYIANPRTTGRQLLHALLELLDARHVEAGRVDSSLCDGCGIARGDHLNNRDDDAHHDGGGENDTETFHEKFPALGDDGTKGRCCHGRGVGRNTKNATDVR